MRAPTPAEWEHMSWNARKRYTDRMHKLAAERRAQPVPTPAPVKRSKPHIDYDAAIRRRAQAYLDQMNRTPADIAAAHLTELWLAVGGTDPKASEAA